MIEVKVTQEILNLFTNATSFANTHENSQVLALHLYFGLAQTHLGKQLLELCQLPVPARACVTDTADITKIPLEPNFDYDNFNEDQKKSVESEVHNVLRRMDQISRRSNHEAIQLTDLLLALFSDSTESWFFQLLTSMSVDYEASFELLLKNASNLSLHQAELREPFQKLSFPDNLRDSEEEDAMFAEETGLDSQENESSDISPTTFTVYAAESLRATLTASKCFLHREAEVEHMLQALAKRTRPHVFLTGCAGSGKTALLYRLHQQFEDTSAELFLLDPISLIKGIQYRTEVVQRLRSFCEILAQHNQDVILSIDDFGKFHNAYASSEMFQELLLGIFEFTAQSKIPLILVSDDETYTSLTSAFDELQTFTRIKMTAFSETQVIEITNIQKVVYEKYHHTKFTRNTIQRIVQLCRKRFPKEEAVSRVFEVLDLASTIENTTSAKPIDTEAKCKAVKIKNVYLAFSRLSGIPIAQLQASEAIKLKTLATQLQKVVFGQDEALQTISNAILRAKAGLANERKPIGSFLLSGPTGVGKTETARQLAKQLDLQLIRLDMSEFSEAHTVSKLIGSPPGYVGYQQDGVLFQKLKEAPAAVILFDEIEKAHESVHRLLLQILDYGTLSSSSGKSVSFRESVIILTSNAGVNRVAKASIGFGENRNTSFENDKISEAFSAELRNRLDALLTFNALQKPQILQIVNKLEVQLAEKLKKKHVTLNIETSAKDYLATHGYQVEFGARPLERLFQTELSDRLAAELLYGKLKDGGSVKVTTKNESLDFTF